MYQLLNLHPKENINTMEQQTAVDWLKDMLEWNYGEVKTSYFVWVDLNCVTMFETEAEAMAAVESIKNSKHQIGSETIFFVCLCNARFVKNRICNFNGFASHCNFLTY